MSPSGDITVFGGQRIHLGLTNATKTVEILVEARYLRVMDQGATIKVVARNTPKEVNRFKATGKAYRSSGCVQASSWSQHVKAQLNLGMGSDLGKRLTLFFARCCLLCRSVRRCCALFCLS